MKQEELEELTTLKKDIRSVRRVVEILSEVIKNVPTDDDAEHTECEAFEMSLFVVSRRQLVRIHSAMNKRIAELRGKLYSQNS